jgi:ABC-2 type transport system permease protein
MKGARGIGILRIARKTLREYLREPQLFLFVLLGPAVLVLLWYVIFLPIKDRMSDYLKILVLDRDSGSEARGLVDTLRAISFEGKPAADVKSIGRRDDGLISLREGKVALMIVIPDGFSRAIDDARGGGSVAEAPDLEYVGDSGSYNYVFDKSFIDPYVRGYIQYQSSLGLPAYGNYEFLPGTGTSSDFDAAIPGLLVFSLLFLIISSASTLVQEDMHRTLARFRLARVSGFELVAGVGLAQMVLAILEVAIGFLLAVALGYGRGTEMLQPMRVILLFGVSILFAVPVVGLGMITAAFARTDGEAASLGSIFLVPLVFLSGILFPMPAVPLFSIADRTVGLYDLMPSTLAAEAIRKAVTLGDLSSIGWPVTGLLLQTVILLSIGAWLYQKRKLRA